MSAEERETLSLGLARDHSLRTMATVSGRPHPELRVGPQRHVGPTLSGLHGAYVGDRSGSSAAAATQTLEPLTVAVCEDPFG
jgi:hypothetical protein